MDRLEGTIKELKKEPDEVKKSMTKIRKGEGREEGKKNE